MNSIVLAFVTNSVPKLDFKKKNPRKNFTFFTSKLNPKIVPNNFEISTLTHFYVCFLNQCCLKFEVPYQKIVFFPQFNSNLDIWEKLLRKPMALFTLSSFPTKVSVVS
jgi:hypothetical protein